LEEGLGNHILEWIRGLPGFSKYRLRLKKNRRAFEQTEGSETVIRLEKAREKGRRNFDAKAGFQDGVLLKRKREFQT